MGTTDHFALKTLGPGESNSDDGYQFGVADRQVIDRLLYQGAVGHHHDGAAGLTTAPSLAPSLVVTEGAGAIAAATRIYYKYTYVDVYGNETAASPEGYIDTPASLDSPASPTLQMATTGGTLISGNYYYVLTAYKNISSQETLGLSPVWTTVPPNINTAVNTLTMPTLPPGATGFNIYRKTPGGTGYYFLTSTTDSEYVDDGTSPATSTRTTPAANTTNSANSVVITLPGATPTVPEGYTWKLYRTYVTNSYNNSLLTHVVEETSEGSGVITPLFTDLGYSATFGKPPTSTLTFNNPDQIQLTDAEEVQGQLPPGLVSAFPVCLTFHVHGLQSVGTYLDTLVNEYPSFEIIGVRASLGVAPASTPVKVDVYHYVNSATPVWTSIFASTVPQVAVGARVGAVVPPYVGATPQAVILAQGDQLRLDVTQAGGGATPTDRNLSVTVYGWARFTTALSDDPVWE